MPSLRVQVLAEYFGTLLLLAIVAGSGHMGETLGAGNAAVALLGNSIATGAGLLVLITLLGPISGAHFNPVVTLMFWVQKEYGIQKALSFIAAQFTGAVSGIWLTHFMFGLEILQSSSKQRTGPGIWLSEFVSTLILLAVIYLAIRVAKDKVALLVAMVVTSGYWFTSSTFFSNPAVTLARSFTNTFVGIDPGHVVGFILAQAFALGCLLIFVRTNKAA
ncbi:MAG: aquaporin family protein [Burkholderiaceae bacterium]|nr:aquaporin family protein [Burkholderiaceae bacterium]